MALRFTPLFVAAAVLAGLCCRPSQAAAQVAPGQVRIQQAQVQVAGNLPLNLLRPSAHSVEQMESLMELHIDTLQRVAGLTDSQIDKLRLAATTGAKSIFQNPEKFGVLPGVLVKPTNMQPDTAAQEEARSLSDEDAESTKPAPKNTDEFIEGFMAFPPSVPLATVLEHEVWKKAEASVLSAEQQQMAAEYWRERKLSRRRSAVEKKISEMDQLLYFTADQRTQMTEIVDRVLGDELEQEVAIVGVAIPNLAAKKLTPDNVHQVLSPVQLERFKKYLDQSGNPLAGLGPLAAAVQQALGQAAPVIGQPFLPGCSRIGIEANEDDKQVVVKAVKPQSLAKRLGLQVGDVLVSVNGQPVEALIHLEIAAMQIQPERSEVLVVVERNGEQLTLENE